MQDKPKIRNMKDKNNICKKILQKISREGYRIRRPSIKDDQIVNNNNKKKQLKKP